MRDFFDTEKKCRNHFVNNMFSVLICLLPLLNAYSVKRIPGALSDIAIVFMAVMTAVSLVRNPRISYSGYGNLFLPYAVVIFFSFLFHTELSGAVTDYLRQFFMLFIAVFGLSRFGSFSAAFKALEVTAVFTSIYCWMQVFFLYVRNTILPSYLPFFEHRSDLDFEYQYLNHKSYYRPHSIFSEPSIFCEYILLYFILLLFHDMSGNQAGLLSEGKSIRKYKRKKFVKILFITATCFITGSTTGILGCVIFLALYFWRSILKADNMLQKTGKYFPLIAAALLCLMNTPMFRIFVTRVFIDHSSLNLRFGNIGYIFDGDFLYVLFGRGFAYDDVVREIGWIPGYALVIVYFGMAGLGILLAACGILYHRISRKNYLGKAVFLYFVIMNCTSYPLFSAFFLTDLFFIFHTKQHGLENICQNTSALAGETAWNL